MTHSASMPAQLGRYRILKPLGQGGMGSVYLAEDTLLRRRVAVKVPLLDRAKGPATRERFSREARAAAAIKHPNVCPILDIGEDNGLPFLVMEFIEGTPLSELSEAGHPWPVQRAAALVRQLARAVGELHQRGLVHRDLKPGNVMVRPDSEPVLMDFGLARSFTSQTSLVTADGAMVGSPAYMAPEQVRGDNEAIGPATDIYALGVILYGLLTGTLPFQGPPATVYGQVLHAPPEPPSARRPGFDRGLDALCLRALAKDPGQRFASTAELAAALAPYAGSRLSEETEVVRAARPSASDGTLADTGRSRHRRVWPWAAAVLLLAGLCWVGIILWPKEKGDPGHRPGQDLTKGTPAPTALPEDFTNSIGMRLVLVKPGRFPMGCPPGELGTGTERPQHWVAITKPFYVGAYEVTQREYETVMGKGRNPSRYTTTFVGVDTSRFPVESVTCVEAEEFCRLLSEREKDEGRRYRLPTEAEWEYACRGGHKYKGAAPFYILGPSDSLDATQANFDGKYPYGKAEKKPSPGRPVPVGSYPPNPLGLYDMHGNVCEWCADAGRPYENKTIQDPVGRENSADRIVRGGGWSFRGAGCRTAARDYRLGVRTRDINSGFRVVCVPARVP